MDVPVRPCACHDCCCRGPACPARPAAWLRARSLKVSIDGVVVSTVSNATTTADIDLTTTPAGTHTVAVTAVGGVSAFPLSRATRDIDDPNRVAVDATDSVPFTYVRACVRVCNAVVVACSSQPRRTRTATSQRWLWLASSSPVLPRNNLAPQARKHFRAFFIIIILILIINFNN